MPRTSLADAAMAHHRQVQRLQMGDGRRLHRLHAGRAGSGGPAGARHLRLGLRLEPRATRWRCSTGSTRTEPHGHDDAARHARDQWQEEHRPFDRRHLGLLVQEDRSPGRHPAQPAQPRALRPGRHALRHRCRERAGSGPIRRRVPGFECAGRLPVGAGLLQRPAAGALDRHQPATTCS